MAEQDKGEESVSKKKKKKKKKKAAAAAVSSENDPGEETTSGVGVDTTETNQNGQGNPGMAILNCTICESEYNNGITNIICLLKPPLHEAFNPG